MTYWRRYPFVRLIFPLLPGFLLGRWFAELWGGINGVSSVFVALLVFSACCCWFFSRRADGGEASGGAKRPWHFGAALYLFFLFFGLWRSFGAWQALDVRWAAEERGYRVLITDSPKPSERAVTAEALLLGSEEASDGGRHKIRLSFTKDARSLAIRTGDEIIFQGRVARPENRGNPDEFDEVEYLSVKGIGGRAFVSGGAWEYVCRAGGWSPELSLMMNLRIQALRLRDRISDAYRSAGLQGEPLALLSALTLGEKAGLSRELRELYAETGTSHILALSGMHLGFLVVVLNYFLLRKARRRFWREVGAAAALLLVWGYTFLAGLPPSLVRAAAMYSLMLFGSLWGRNGFSVNALAATALTMLCIDPLWLYDVGFQLSFLSMTGILTVFPLMGRWSFMQWPYVGWVMKSLGISFSAQLFTVPLVACRFGTFSLYSAWATLLVSPLTALLIYTTPLLCLSAATGWGLPWVAKGVSALVMLQNGCLRWMAEWPGALWHVDCPLGGMMVCYVVLLVMLSCFWLSRAAWLKSLLAAILLAVCAGLAGWHQKRNFSGLVFYNNPRCPAVHLIYSPDCSYLFPAVADSARQGMAYIAGTFWKKKLSAEPVWVAEDFKDERVSARSGLVSAVGGISFLILSDGRWQDMESGVQADVDYMYVCRGFEGSLEELSRLFRPRCVVLDASLRSAGRRRYIRACETLGWKFYDMKAGGALKVALN